MNSNPPFEGTKGEEDIDWNSDRREMNRQESDIKVGENSEDELSHNNEVCSVPPANPRQRKRRDRAPLRRRRLSNTVLRLLDCNMEPTRVRYREDRANHSKTPCRHRLGPIEGLKLAPQDHPLQARRLAMEPTSNVMARLGPTNGSPCQLLLA